VKAAVSSWLWEHRRVFALKLAVAFALAYSHYFPESKASLWVNLLWLFLF
jgi:hypothetical protein